MIRTRSNFAKLTIETKEHANPKSPNIWITNFKNLSSMQFQHKTHAFEATIHMSATVFLIKSFSEFLNRNWTVFRNQEHHMVVLGLSVSSSVPQSNILEEYKSVWCCRTFGLLSVSNFLFHYGCISRVITLPTHQSKLIAESGGC